MVNIMKYADIKNVLLSISDPVEKLEFVMDLGKQLTVVPDSAICTEITGCASRVQICHDADRFYGAADSALVRGIVAIIIAMTDGKTLAEIQKIDMHNEFKSLDLNLGAGRMNGLNSIISFFQKI